MKRKIRKKILKQIKASGSHPCNICKNPDILIEHHIEGRDIPNAEHPSNRVLLCSSCHTKVHEGWIIIEGWFGSTSGSFLLWHSRNEESFSGKDKKTYQIERKA